MRFKWVSDYWLGLVVSLTLTALSLWLAVQGKLALYIHPRYIWFTVILCSLALLCILADLATRKRTPQVLAATPIRGIFAGLLCVVFCAAIILLRPAGLTSSAAGQRGVNTAATTVTTDKDLTDLSSAQIDYTQFSLKEWAALLSQSSDVGLFTGKPASFSGFITPTADNSPDVFYASRFVVTCCAVDARPIGVPIYRPDWQKDYSVDQWLDIRGSFMQNPESGNTPIVLQPQTMNPIGEPDEPYAY